ncbi:MAG: FHA domain-containing protein [Fimbriiglobus sp.]
MSDPRLDETHLDSPRREHYIEAREDVYDAMGPTTGDVEKEFHVRKLPVGFVPSPARFAMRDLTSGQLHMLRVGINTLGRHPQNDIVLEQSSVSRRHCVIVVHASGQVELRDTASRSPHPDCNAAAGGNWSVGSAPAKSHQDQLTPAFRSDSCRVVGNWKPGKAGSRFRRRPNSWCSPRL